MRPLITFVAALLAVCGLASGAPLFLTGESCIGGGPDPMCAAAVFTPAADGRWLWTWETSSFVLTAEIDYEADPFVVYGFAITNLLPGPLAFSNSVSTLYEDGPYVVGLSTHSSSITDGNRDGMVSITAALGGVHQPSYDGIPFGAIDGSCVRVGSGLNSAVCAMGDLYGIPILTGVTGILRIDLAGTISGGDIYTFNGAAEISNIPEPAAQVLVGSALLLAAGILRRRRRSGM